MRNDLNLSCQRLLRNMSRQGNTHIGALDLVSARGDTRGDETAHGPADVDPASH